MLITLTRTGGFTSIPLKKTIDTSTLPQEKKEEIEKNVLFIFSQKSSIIHNTSSINTLPDQFTYHLSVQDGARNQEVTMQENDIDDKTKELFNKLLRVD